MAKLLKIKNPPFPSQEETYIASNYTSGITLTVRNSEGFADGDIIVVGNPGEEQTEQASVASAPTSTTITIDSALNFSHNQGVPIYKVQYNQVSIERKPTGGSYAVIVAGLQNLEWDEKDGYSKVYVTEGEDTDTYKWRFYNSATNTYSTYSGELPGTGLTAQYAGHMIEVIRMFAKLPAKSGLTDLQLLSMLNRGQKKIDSLHDRWWFALTEDSSSTRVQAIAGTYQYDLPSTFRGMDSVKVLDTNSLKYNLTFVPMIEFDSLKIDTSSGTRDDTTKCWSLLPPDSSNTIGYFGVHPTPETTTNYFYRRYYRFMPDLSSFASQTLIPLPEALINWVMYEIYKIREDRDNSKYYLGLFNEDVVNLRRLQRRQIGQAEIVRFRGQRGYGRLFGDGLVGLSNDTYRENYW